MISILVVDDDKNERSGIQFLLRKLPLEINISECSNGELALDFLTEHEIDILITDIKMPFMDGLELGKKARQLCPDIKIVILSAYGEFEYAQRAISFNVDGYLLKPVEAEEFGEVIQRLVSEYEQERLDESEKSRKEKQLMSVMYHAEEKLLLDFISYKNVSSQMIDSAHLMGIHLCEPSTRLILIDTTNSPQLESDNFLQKVSKKIKSNNYNIVFLNEKQLLIFFNYSLQSELENFVQTLESIFEQGKGMRYFIVISEAVMQYGDLFDAYQKLDATLEYTFFAEKSEIIFTENLKKTLTDSNAESIINGLMADLDNCDLAYGFSIAQKLLDLFSEKVFHSVIYVKYNVCEIVKKLIINAGEKFSYYGDKYLNKIFLCSDIFQMKEVIFQLSEELFEVADRSDDRSVIKKVKAIIENEYMNDLSLGDISARVYLTPSYLSYLFKRESACSFIRYLTQFRLQKSKELLENSNIKINDISIMVGYPNSSYFSLLFKNYFGVTPAKYRELKGLRG